VGGVLVYVVGQLLSKLFIEPARELRITIAEVRFTLAFHASTIHTPISRNEQKSQQARDALLKSSCDLLTKVAAIPFYDFVSWVSLRFLPPRRSIVEAATQLRGLSTYISESDSKANDALEAIEKRVTRIEKALGLEPLQ